VRRDATRISAALDLGMFRQMADMSNEAFFLTDAQARYRYVNDRALTFTGYSREELLGMTLFDLDPEYPRDQYHLVVEALAHGPLPPFEGRTRRRDGSYAPCEVSIARIDVDGEMYIFGVVRDITERKQIEAAQRSFTQRLLETLEAERQRVARELHDDVGKAVASVGGLLTSLETAPGGVPGEARPALTATHAMIRNVTDAVARVVRDYHPAELVGLGLADSIATHAGQFAERHGLALQLSSAEIDDVLTREQELHVYRIVQEALANVARHAGARRVTLRLERRPRHVAVTVQDDGEGFDSSRAKAPTGLGLVTMRERASLMHATLRVRSVPGGGTEIQLLVPVDGAVPAPRRGIARRATALPRGRKTSGRVVRGRVMRRDDP
jgi:PAS domain S-box-containing protein